MKIAALQLSLEKSQKEIKNYLEVAHLQKVKLILFGEYFFGSLFKTLEQSKKGYQMTVHLRYFKNRKSK